MILLFIFLMLPAIVWGMINPNNHMVRIDGGVSAIAGGIYSVLALAIVISVPVLAIPIISYFAAYLGIGLVLLGWTLFDIPHGELFALQSKSSQYAQAYPPNLEDPYAYDAAAARAREEFREEQQARGHYLYWQNVDVKITMHYDIATRLLDRVILWLPVMVFHATRNINPINYVRKLVENNQK